MRFKMVENAIDSLQITIEAFDKWTRCRVDKRDRYLKLTIVFLHNSMELLLKSLLIKRDDTSIYIDICDKRLEEARKECKRRNKTLDECLIKDYSVKTIPYSVAVEKYAENYKCDEKVVNILNALGKYRNAITHFGIDSRLDMDRLYNIVYESLAIVIYEFWEELIDIDEYFEYNDVIDMFESWYEAGIDFQLAACVENSKKKIYVFTGILDKVMHSEKFKNYIDAYDIRVKDSSKDYDTNEIYLDFEILQKYVSVATFYSPYFNYTFFCDLETMEIWFVVNHYEDKVYIYYDNVEYIPDRERENMIRDDIGVHCEVKPLTENRIRNIIIDRLRGIYNTFQENEKNNG